jgi:hypothetical protein
MAARAGGIVISWLARKPVKILAIHRWRRKWRNGCIGDVAKYGGIEINMYVGGAGAEENWLKRRIGVSKYHLAKIGEA